MAEATEVRVVGTLALQESVDFDVWVGEDIRKVVDVGGAAEANDANLDGVAGGHGERLERWSVGDDWNGETLIYSKMEIRSRHNSSSGWLTEKESVLMVGSRFLVCRRGGIYIPPTTWSVFTPRRHMRLHSIRLREVVVPMDGSDFHKWAVM